MHYEIIPTEYSSGVYKGVDYGSTIRIVMRSAQAVLFVGYGLNLVNRGDEYARYDRKIAENAKRSSLENPAVRQKIIDAFGEGADIAAIATTEKRGWATALFEGGGDKLSLPAVEARRRKKERYASLTATREFIPDDLKTCMQCGEKLVMKTDHHRFPRIPVSENHPRTVEECQRLSNHPIVRVDGYSEVHSPEWWPLIERFETWDGESYHDDMFCNDKCAAKYGRRAATELAPLEVGVEPLKKKYVPRESFQHLEEEREPRYVDGVSGRIRIE